MCDPCGFIQSTFQRLDARTQLRDLIVPLGIGAADGNVLRTVPVKGRDTDHYATLHLGACSIMQKTDDFGGFDDPRMAPELQAFPARAIKRDDRHTVIMALVSQANILLVASKVRVSDCPLVDDLDETGPPP